GLGDLYQTVESGGGQSLILGILSNYIDLTTFVNGGNAGDIAEQNYELWISGKLENARNVAETIATIGSQQLNENQLNALIQGSGRTIERVEEVYGENSGVAFLSSLDPHNNGLGLQGLIAQNLGQQTEEAVTNVVNDVQTPQKFLNKTECIEYADDGSCAREVTTTPGDIVSSQLQKVLHKEPEQAANTDGSVLGSFFAHLGDLTDGLIQIGVNKLTNQTSNLLFDTHAAQEEFGFAGGYQSGYDVLGVSSNPIFNETDSSGNVINGGGGLLNATNIFICGPEDTSVGCQVVINFQQDLQQNIEMLEEEKSYYDGIRTTLVDAFEVITEFDKCIPGPDFNWEERYKNVLPTFGGEDQNQINAIGLNQTRNMLEDPRVTIPGGVDMVKRVNAILDQTQNEAIANKFRIDEINSALSTLNVIKQEVLQDFNQQKASINLNLVLFVDDWEQLNPSQKINATEAAVNGFVKNGQSTPSKYLSLKEEFGETPTSIVANEEERARNAVLAMSWDVWRDRASEDNTKTLRESFYVIQTKFSGDEQIAIAKVKLKNLNYNIDQSYNTASDCLVFKTYALGFPRSSIAAITETSQTQAEKIKQLAALIAPFEPTPGNGIFTDFQYFDNSTVRSDSAIREFLQSENALQTVGSDASVFSTLLMTTPAYISNSILGFNSEAEKEEYFDTYYPDDDLPSEV
ncbi:hypothetical protein KC901_02970, partial [Patescibacteria group bacterium]|nr:hypothetical protein [Patescibacteria group bacterium]